MIRFSLLSILLITFTFDYKVLDSIMSNLNSP